MVRDLAPDLIDIEAIDDNPTNAMALESLIPELLIRAKKALTEAEASPATMRRIRTAVGGDEVWARLPVVMNALRCRGLLEKAQAFGRAANSMATRTRWRWPSSRCRSVISRSPPCCSRPRSAR